MNYSKSLSQISKGKEQPFRIRKRFLTNQRIFRSMDKFEEKELTRRKTFAKTLGTIGTID